MTYFVHAKMPEYYSVLQRAYRAALEYANSVSKTTGIKMAVERLRPAHLNEAAYSHPYNGGAVKNYTLLTNCGVFAAGLYDASANLRAFKFWNGKEYIGDWVVRDVYKFDEQQGAYAGELAKYQWLSNEVIGIQTVQAGVADEDAWVTGFAVMPEALRDGKIVV